MTEPTDADRALVEREIARLTERGTIQDIALASLIRDVPTDIAVTFIRDQLLRGLGGAPRADYWLLIQELNFFAHRERRKEARRTGRVMSPGYRSAMAMNWSKEGGAAG